MKKKRPQVKVISNRRARHDYAIDDSVLVGIELTGKETKALRMGHGTLRGAYVTVKGSELWLVNAQITGAPGIVMDESEQTRSRRLLAKRKEIDQLIHEKQQGKTIVPLELLTRTRFIKLRIASGKGRRQYDKRQAIKAREQSRSIKFTV